MSLKRFLIVAAIFVVPLLVVEAVYGVTRWRFKRRLYAREDSRMIWQAQFPDAMPLVERFLSIFADAFLVRIPYKYRFCPDDRVMQVYKNTTGRKRTSPT